MAQAARVLDPCCGSRMMWFDRQHPDAIYGDKRAESHVLCDGRQLHIQPDAVMDFRALPFADGSFNLVVFDPPHLKHAGPKSWLRAKYGVLEENWRDDLRQGFAECFRVLASNGTLIFKWAEDQVKVCEVLELAPYPPPIWAPHRPQGPDALDGVHEAHKRTPAPLSRGFFIGASMAENTKIEWTDHTFNPWEGCQKVGPGCDNCYAETRNARYAGGKPVNWGPGAPRRRTSTANWQLPIKWNKAAELAHSAWEGFKAQHPGLTDDELLAKGFTKPRRPRVFCASLADVFDNAVDPQWRADLFSLIQKTPYLDWLLLTKRIGNVVPMLEELCHGSDEHLSLLDMMPLPNVWIGATIVNQEEADRDIPKLLAVPAKVCFLSMEPLLGPVDLTQLLHQPCRQAHLTGIDPDTGAFECCKACDYTGISDELGIDWVIVGGESGPGARPMHPDWARSLRDQCEAAGTAFLFKQWGEWVPAKRDGNTLVIEGVTPFTDKPEWRDLPDGQAVARIGKKAAGRLLDGRTWDEFPENA